MPRRTSSRSSTMPGRGQYAYAQLPVYQYHNFDKKNLTYSEYPVIPRTPRSVRYFGEGTDADEPTKNDHNPPDQPLDIEMSEPAVEIIDAPAEGKCNLYFQNTSSNI